MKKNILIFILLWIWFIQNPSFSCEIKKNNNDWYIIDENKWKDKKQYNYNVNIKYYQNHLVFIQTMINKHPYLKNDIIHYHKLFNKWFLELNKNEKISKNTLDKIKKQLKNLYLKIWQYE